MELLRQADINPAPLKSKKVAIIGFGNQGRAQALNLKDSGIDVVVGLRPDSTNIEAARSAGIAVQSLEEAAASADLVMFLTPDEVIPILYRQLEPLIRKNAAIGFSHGLALHFSLVTPRADLDVLLVAPKGPGTALRSLYQEGKGMIALWAVGQDSGQARELALAYGRAIGCARAGLIASSFAEECEADLFNEHAVVWGAVPEILRAGFEVLVGNGVSPEVAYLECVGELKLIAELIEKRGIAGMREAISNTAELGAALGGPSVIDDAVRQKMEAVLSDIRSGDFARELERERDSGYARLRAARNKARGESIEAIFERLSALTAD